MIQTTRCRIGSVKFYCVTVLWIIAGIYDLFVFLVDLIYSIEKFLNWKFNNILIISFRNKTWRLGEK